MSYGDSKVCLRLPRNVVRKFAVDRRSATVLDGSATVLSRPHYGDWRLSKINTTVDECRRSITTAMTIDNGGTKDPQGLLQF